MSDYVIELACCEQVMLTEIARKGSTRRQVSQLYAMSLRSSERPTIDWAKVNAAIMAKWSRNALEWIKTNAWNGKCWDDKQ
jgi:hypothetical protein